MTDTDAQRSDDPAPGLFQRLRKKWSATQRSLGQGLGDLLLGERRLDDTLVDDIETQLLAADVGVDTAQALTADIARGLTRKELADTRAVYRRLRQDILAIVQPAARPLVPSARPFVVMVVGVNGVGKTTTIGKIAHRLRREGRSVLLAAGDTFRAAAIEQLQAWGKRIDAPVIAQHTGADAGAVAHDALNAARARAAEVVLIDTAGRQHTHAGLMDELKKVKRVIAKVMPDAPHEVLLVLDAGTGQNALAQLEHFGAAVGVTGIALTKLDGTAKGGILIAIAKKSGLPIRFVGVGESADDLQGFDAAAFVDALLPEARASA
ncbi:MAG: signal recognition particle-docking protein FtsY [Gammaproteobacteria bacterium]